MAVLALPVKNNIMKNVIVFVVVIASLASCRSTKKIGTAIARKDSTQITVATSATADSSALVKQTLQQIRANRIEFNTFSGKINVDYRSGDGKNYDVNATMRMYKDSAIWLSANAVLGIEAMRVLITKDSVKLLNKLDKTYTARSVDYLQEVTELPLNLAILQDLLIGNPVYLDSNIVSYSRGNNAISLVSLGAFFKHFLTVAEGDKLLQRSRLDDADISRSRTAELTYSDYQNGKGPQFATKRTISIAEKKKLDIKLDFKNYDLNGEVSFPFSVPKNFRRK
jgi:hypothetical protein